ncbi:MAG: N-6 DNA methylase [Candidatus Binataceae bacterium]
MFALRGCDGWLEAGEIVLEVSEAGSTRIHEQDFCSEVAKWADEIFALNPASPFSNARIEGFGSGSQRRKRKDLRVYDKHGKVALTGEVKLPGTVEGRSPFDAALVQEAQTKADSAGARYFFTWNVNSFVLWDRYQQDRPLLDRWVREWKSGRNLRNPDEVGRAENLAYIKSAFLPELLLEIGDIYTGRRADWQMTPDDLFIRSFESHLAWPVELTRAYLAQESESSRAFDNRLREWMARQNWQFVRRPLELWGEALERAAQTIVYVPANRLIFYQSLRARFADLPGLRLPSRAKTADDAYRALQGLFKNAVRRSGDYEPLFYPDEKQDWAGPLVFAHPSALDAWRGTLRGIEAYDFSHISSEVVGRIFQRLISPEERHRWGQHFTGDDVVDLINAFCIREAGAAVLDPACGSGSFLVRAYYRKRHLSPKRPHLRLLSELFGCDIAVYPAHLATLNLAAREINDEANYPRVTTTTHRP